MSEVAECEQGSNGSKDIRSWEKKLQELIIIIQRGLNEIEDKNVLDKNRIRKEVGVRKKLTTVYVDLSKDLEELLESSNLGDPESPLLWICKSTYNLADELKNKKYLFHP